MEHKRTPMAEPDWKAYAHRDARDWRRKVTPEELEFFRHQREILSKQGRDEAEMVEIWSQTKDGNGLLHRLHENEEWFEYQLEVDDGSDPHDKAREEYSRAWLDYVHGKTQYTPGEPGELT